MQKNVWAEIRQCSCPHSSLAEQSLYITQFLLLKSSLIGTSSAQDLSDFIFFARITFITSSADKLLTQK